MACSMGLIGKPVPRLIPSRNCRCQCYAGSSQPAASRRDLLTRSLAAVALVTTPPGAAGALTVADVTPVVAPAPTLSARELQIIGVFERSAPGIVNVFDATLAGRPAPEVDVPEGNGTGFLWDARGHVVTNWHVLANSLKGLNGKGGPAAAMPGESGPRVARISLLSPDNRQQSFDGVLVGADRARDLAVVRINAPPELLRPLPRGTSSTLRVGQLCLAIGNPFGFDHTLSTGVVSGLNREIRSMAGVSIPGGIQTDASINPGNSGGPLLDANGNVIGVNTAIFTPTGTSAGIAFAINIDIVNRVVPQLIEFGKVVRPSLSVQVASDEVARRLQVTRGALLQSLVPGGAADRAGLLATRRGLTGIVAGDVVLSVEGRPITTGLDLTNVLDDFQPGDTVKLTVRRSGDSQPQELNLSVTLDAEK